ncbi:hypothetical protein K505DRAFT_262033, partial [Melanomma pulvis-pyrius CBS 109.77]
INIALYKYLNIFVIVYLDNVLVYLSRILKEYVKHVKKVLTKLKEKKSKFYTIRTKFLEFIISRETIKIDSKKTEVI